MVDKPGQTRTKSGNRGNLWQPNTKRRMAPGLLAAKLDHARLDSISVETIESDYSGLRSELYRHQLDRLITGLQFHDDPTTMHIVFATPVSVRDEMRAKLLDRSKRLDSRVKFIIVA
jgi:hypothetical protein